MAYNKILKSFFPDETLITVRALGFCEKQKLQEFARVKFLDDFADFMSKREDHEPLTIRPDYFENTKKIVRLSDINRKEFRIR